MSALVSVVMPCYNQGRYLADALDSLRGQRHADWECLLVDDGSTDETPRIAARYAAVDPRIRVHATAHGGQCAARNHALDRVRGRYVQFLDADDVIAADKLAEQVARLRDVEALAVAYCDYRFADADDPQRTVARGGFDQPRFRMRRPLADLAWRWETELSIPNNCFLFDARLFREHRIRFDGRLENHVDWDCWMQVFRLEPRLVHVPRPLATYRIHAGSITRNREAMERGFRAACRKQREVFADDPAIRRLLRRKELALMSRAWRHACWRFYARTVPWPVQKALRRVWADASVAGD